ncbi:MAG: hypothetical protein D3922_05545, partial [Candidatus Electrothrix sp. AR1]|nr:hypothetical protein [Candidatus Electrothrix sp. AR1]
KTESLESIIAGGIAMATPEEPGTSAEDGDHFLLAKEADEDWLAWSPKITLPQKEKLTEQYRVRAGKKKKRVSGKEKR